MTYDEFKRQIGKAGITAREFTALVKLNPNSITNYAKTGIVPSHLTIIVTLMGELADNKIDFMTAIESIDFESKKPRGKLANDGFKKKKTNSVVSAPHN